MVDSSGSTVRETDPNKYYRVQVLNKFLADYGAKSNFSYSYGMFTSVYKYFSPASNSFVRNASIPFFDSSKFQDGLDVYQALDLDRDGNTFYEQAFAGLKANILADIEVPGSPKSYAVVFMSDGEPKDLSEPLTESAADLVEDLVMAVANKGGAARVSSVYFGPTTETKAINVMRSIAIAGHGQFVDTNMLPSNALEISDAISIPGEDCGE